ncbi:MAG: hypothetical protein BWY54_00737 [Candidatus Dependentiae bacterium ADurb.Bin331]|nr:MAG: hypothetical protein BWY54_00737 [Candidatus Dependentiae bacterium ADurb.Bin331]
MKKLVILFFLVMPIHAMEEGEQVLETRRQFAQVYKEAGKIYVELRPKLRHKFLEQGDCIVMLGKIVVALGEQDHEAAMNYYKRFKERTYLDYKWLNEKQAETYAELKIELDSMVMEIQPQSIKDMLPSEQQDIDRLQARQWLKGIVENNTCEGLEWCSLFGKPDSTTKYLTPEYLRNERLKTIASYGQLKKMDNSEQLD